MTRVLVADPLDEAGVERLRQAGAEVDVRHDPDRAALLARIGEYDALVVRSETRVDAAVLEAGKRLRVVGRAGTGVDNIDVEAATRRGVVVVNTPEANTVAAAEHALALMLAVARRIPWAHHSLASERRWERHRFMGVQLAGKTLGLVGLGRIGTEVARRARAMGMTVVAHDPYVTGERAAQLGVELMDLDPMLERCDFVSIHCPLTPRTRHLLDASRLARLRPTAYLVNCARGGIVDEAALARALAQGRLAGAALDVYETEPLPADSPLFGLPNVVMTPHLGASTREAQASAARTVAEEVLRVLSGELPHSAVNLPSIPPERWPRARHHVELARRLGRAFAELFGPEAMARLEIVYRGELAHAPESGALTAAVLWGVLTPVMQEGVTLASAPVLARERGMEVVETHSHGALKEQEAATGALILLRSRPRGSDSAEVSVAGHVGDDGRPRLVAINGYRIDVEESGYLLVSSHQDRPGIIGKVGTILGQHQINIAYMQVGRDRPGGHAVMVVGVDQEVPPGVVETLRRIPDLWDIRVVEW
ncbi:phosphoglycerate dehydrogenase [Carboxydochorda subterranea]|uniref:D-3-phosphoglycerate dehydrogenase n=1 Tax=Carboxydichorda subterranea TaxID=3109565 RepID=A0ABZ1BUD1_9FIRM|nr:phosphoglycerate dehydrogenase [Limnochorda sp. L945t]WRP16407.1 phosphoglycerate dehydrogenase [Limnochorda sp. L945t]